MDQTIGITGYHTFIKCDALNPIAAALSIDIEKAMSIGDKEKAGFLLKSLKEKFQTYAKTYKNIVTTVGRTTLAQIIAGDVDYTGTGAINYGALGSGTTTPANADTTLDTETFRKTIASYEVINNLAIISQFYNSGEANAQHYESGVFIDGTASVDTGILFCRFLINELKTSSETLTIESNFTFTQ